MNKATRIVLVYLLVALAWIIFSDRVMMLFARGVDPQTVLVWQSYKGGAFVVFTGLLLFLMIRHQQVKLIASEKQYRGLFANNPNPMWVYNRQTLKFIEVNKAAILRYGYSREEFLNMTILDIRPGEDMEEIKAFARNLNDREGEAKIWRHYLKSGTEIIVSITSYCVNFNDQDCALVLAADVSELFQQKKQLEEAYKKEVELNEALAEHFELIKQSNEQNRRLGEILEKVENFVVVCNPQGMITWINRAFAQFFEMDIYAIQGSYIARVFDPKAENQNAIKQIETAITEKNSIIVELLNHTSSGKSYWLQANISPFYNEAETLDGFIFVLTQITERKQREEQIRQQNIALRQFAWVSSHELRKPVSSIISLVNMIKNSDDADEQKECIHLLGNCSEELDGMVKDIVKKLNKAEREEPLV